MSRRRGSADLDDVAFEIRQDRIADDRDAQEAAEAAYRGRPEPAYDPAVEAVLDGIERDVEGSR